MLQVINHGSQEMKEQPESPVIETREGETRVRRTWRGPYDVCDAGQPIVGAWIGNGRFIGMKVTGVSLRREKLLRGVLEVEYSGSIMSAGVPVNQLPPQEVAMEYSEQIFAIEQHPRYKGMTRNDRAIARAAVYAGDELERQSYIANIDALFDAEDPRWVLIDDLYWKLARGESEFVFFAPVVKWTSFYRALPALTGEAFPETPWAPISIPAGFQWLRKADTISWRGDGQYWSVTRQWMGAFKVDEDLYPVPLW